MGSCNSCLKKENQEDIQRQTLLENEDPKPHENEADAALRKVFSRDVIQIPEHSEVNHSSNLASLPSPSDPLLSGSSPPTQPHLERLFSRGAAKGSPIALNRLFSRGAVMRANSNLSLQQKKPRASSAEDSREEEVEEIRDSLNGVFSPPVTTRKLIDAGIEDIGVSDSSDEIISPMIPTIYSTTQVAVPERKFPQIKTLIMDLPTVSERLVIGGFKADTADRPDHTFSGIMFNVEARRGPFQFMEIQSISVRGELGRISIYATPKTYEGKFSNANEWVRHFGPRELPPSRFELCDLNLDTPIRLAPGTMAGIYVHSELPNDEAIVYADQKSDHLHTYENEYIRIRSDALAHTSPVPFQNRNEWGGNAWRRGREFVGSMTYGIKLLLWTPLVHHLFPSHFREGVLTILLCQRRLKTDSIGLLPLDVIFRIINFMPHDWFGAEDGMKEDDESDISDSYQEFRYGGHVGQIASLRHFFDTTRKQNSGEILVDDEEGIDRVATPDEDILSSEPNQEQTKKPTNQGDEL